MTRAQKAQISADSGHGLRDLLRLVGLALLLSAVVRELRLPKEERTWHGRVFGAVPYDLRPPSFERLKTAMWRPQDAHVIVPTALGVGWTVNLAALRTRLSRASAA